MVSQYKYAGPDGLATALAQRAEHIWSLEPKQDSFYTQKCQENWNISEIQKAYRMGRTTKTMLSTAVSLLKDEVWCEVFDIGIVMDIKGTSYNTLEANNEAPLKRYGLFRSVKNWEIHI